MGKLRAYGNAIVPQVAAEVIQAAWEAVEGGDFERAVRAEERRRYPRLA